MDVDTAILCASLAVILLFVLGTPVILCIGLWVSAVSLLIADYGLLANIGQASFYGLKSFALLAMPLFILTGDIVLRSGIAGAITRLARSMLGNIKGSSAVTALLASGVFAAVSGSNAATTATIGNMMHREMTSEGYDPRFAGATCASGGTVGIIIPPSVLFIVYGVLVSVSVGDLFVAGILPGMLMVAAMAVVALAISAKNKWGADSSSSSIRDVLESAWDAKHAFFAIIFALGGIYLGAFSPTEAAGMTVAYLAIATVATGKVRIRELPGIMKGSAEIIGVLGPLIAFSVVLQQVFSFIGRGGRDDILACDLDVARVGALVCYEHHLGLLSAAMGLLGEEVHCAVWPGWWELTRHLGDKRPSAEARFCDIEPVTRAYAIQNGTFVVNSCPYAPDSVKKGRWGGAYVNQVAIGGSSIINPSGIYVVPPSFGGEELVWAEIDLKDRRLAKAFFDPSGHYSRYDVLRLEGHDALVQSIVADTAAVDGDASGVPGASPP